MTLQDVKYEKPKIVDYGFYNPLGPAEDYWSEWETSEGGGSSSFAEWLMRDALFEHDKWEIQAVWAEVLEEARAEVKKKKKDEANAEALLADAEEDEW